MKRVKRMLVSYRQLLERLERKKYARIAEPLKALISEVDFNRIIDYLLNNTHLFKEIALGYSHRLDKKVTGLPRTLTLVRTEEGEFGCILETKSKLRTGDKQKLPNASGAYKTGKPAWEISGVLGSPETECFNLVAQFSSERQREEIEAEANFSRQFESKYVHPYHQSGVFYNSKYLNKKNQLRYKISLYSVKAESDLCDYLRLQKKISQTRKEEMVFQILQGVKAMHEKELVHQDLTLANILICKEGHLALTDFGACAKHEGHEEVKTTAGFHSPEIAYFYSDKSTAYHHYYQKNRTYGMLANQYSEEYYKKKKIQREQFSMPHKANDMWAVGIIIYKIYYGCDENPNLLFDKDMARIKGHPLLSHLLTPDWESRFTIDEAMSMHQKMIASLEEDKPNRKRMRRS